MIAFVFEMFFLCVGSYSYIILPMIGLGIVACAWRLAYFLLGVNNNAKLSE